MRAQAARALARPEAKDSSDSSEAVEGPPSLLPSSHWSVDSPTWTGYQVVMHWDLQTLTACPQPIWFAQSLIRENFGPFTSSDSLHCALPPSLLG